MNRCLFSLADSHGMYNFNNAVVNPGIEYLEFLLILETVPQPD